jgi:hypothetical protein
MSDPIVVQTHVGRDLLQNSVYFSTVPKVIWEYVSNSIDNPGPSDVVNVEVTITKEAIKISDNGSGMSRSDLRRFFQMHGENLKRRQGKNVRGRFGTGKCAAFGIGNKLRIETVQSGLLNICELSREDITRSAGEAIPVKAIADDAQSSSHNGTSVIISSLNTRQLEIPATIAYLQRHLGRQQQKHSVIINDHLCELEEPIFVKEKIFSASGAAAERLGRVSVTVRVSAVPLDPATAGIDVYSYANWHDTTLAGLPVSDLTRRVFGEVEVPALEDYDGAFPPFDNTRNNTLSPQNPLVVVLFAWLGECIQAVLHEVEAEEAERRQSSEAKALRAEAEKIERLLNDDFQALEMELAKARGATPVETAPKDVVGVGRPDSDSPHVLPDQAGTDAIGVVSAGFEPGGGGVVKTNPAGVGDIERPGSGLLPGEGLGSRREPIERHRRSSRFSIEFLHETEAAHRSRYDDLSKTIVINLDHPQVKAALKLGGRDSQGFRQMCYELAIVEYAMAIGYESVRRDRFLSGEDALFSIRDTIQRVTKKLPAAM